jgi:hypothetical protein
VTALILHIPHASRLIPSGERGDLQAIFNTAGVQMSGAGPPARVNKPIPTRLIIGCSPARSLSAFLQILSDGTRVPTQAEVELNDSREGGADPRLALTRAEIMSTAVADFCR